ncbi:polynucleotide 5'-hydroxyl-kinase NOL9-like [Saccostrea echinata]|uniref:polynucleotide 5'-hydroxyl-kinase NOL9-like n=1 Tax=Saccostrea echinata TaxID=191078 RepID=UPI002A83C628|nr:polynucleotide 5'-hydroxyl-kinase NOL9-like [Saccostrea echinata]
MGKTKKQQKSEKPSKVKHSSTFKPHSKKKSKGPKKGKGISSSMLENVLDKQENFYGKRKSTSVKHLKKSKNQNLQASEKFKNPGQSAFTVLRGGVSDETGQKNKSAGESQAERKGPAQNKSKEKLSTKKSKVKQSVSRQNSAEQNTETSTSSVASLPVPSSDKKICNSFKFIGVNIESPDIESGESSRKRKRKKSVKLHQKGKTEESSGQNLKDKSHIKKKGKKRKMDEKLNEGIKNKEKIQDDSTTKKNKTLKDSPRQSGADNPAGEESLPEVINLIESDSEISDSDFSVVDLTLDDTENEAVNFEQNQDFETHTVPEERQALNGEEMSTNAECLSVEDVESDKITHINNRTDSEEVEVGSGQEQHRSRALAAFDGQVLVVLPNPGVYCYLGRCFLKCLHGGAAVLGYQLTDQFEAFYSPSCSSLLTITTSEKLSKEEEKVTESESNRKKKSKFKRKSREILTEQESVEKIYSDWLLLSKDMEKLPREKVTILLARKMESNVCDYISTFKAFHKLWDNPVTNQQRTQDLGTDDLKLNSVGLTFIPDTAEVARQHVSQQQMELIQRWDDLLSSDPAPIVMVVGGKNVGKSTLNRYLVNHTLNKRSELCYLECDIGQTEFTPPGCISLQLVNGPILGPPFTHQKIPKICYYYGGLTATDNPNLYMECIRKCLLEYRKLEKTRETGLPLVVNTMGWIEDLGLELLISVIRMTLPSLLVQINFSNNKMNAAPLTPEFVNDRQGWVRHSRYYRSHYMLDILGDTNHSLVRLDSPTNVVRCRNHWKPFELRDLAVISYMSSTLSKDSSLSLETPYGVPWEDMAINICKRGVPREEWMAAINATIVGLAHADLTEARREKEGEPYFFESTPLCLCIGFGMVRSIDTVKKMIYITTPLSLVDLVNVNTIIRGSSNVPQQIFTEQITKEVREIPYVSRITSTWASKNPRQRKHIPSKSRKKVTETSIGD